MGQGYWTGVIPLVYSELVIREEEVRALIIQRRPKDEKGALGRWPKER
jgi:hypothetical protein